MSKAGDTIENPVTGERIVVRVGTEDSEGELLEVPSQESTSIRASRSLSPWWAGG